MGLRDDWMMTQRQRWWDRDGELLCYAPLSFIPSGTKNRLSFLSCSQHWDKVGAALFVIVRIRVPSTESGPSLERRTKETSMRVIYQREVPGAASIGSLLTMCEAQNETIQRRSGLRFETKDIQL